MFIRRLGSIWGKNNISVRHSLLKLSLGPYANSQLGLQNKDKEICFKNEI